FRGSAAQPKSPAGRLLLETISLGWQGNLDEARLASRKAIAALAGAPVDPALRSLVRPAALAGWLHRPRAVPPLPAPPPRPPATPCADPSERAQAAQQGTVSGAIGLGKPGCGRKRAKTSPRRTGSSPRSRRR